MIYSERLCTNDVCLLQECSKLSASLDEAQSQMTTNRETIENLTSQLQGQQEVIEKGIKRWLSCRRGCQTGVVSRRLILLCTMVMENINIHSILI